MYWLTEILLVPLFFIIIIFFYIIPGFTIVSKLKNFSNWEKLVLSTVSGFILITLLSYILSFLHLRLIIPITVLALNIYIFKDFLKFFKSLEITWPKKSLLIFLAVMIFGIIGQLFVTFPSGIIQNGDLVFWSSHGHDSMWHIALAEKIQSGLPINNPVYSGELLKNYHYFVDISLADLNQFFFLPFFSLYFRLFPLLFSLLLGALAFILAYQMTQKKFSAGIWSIFSVYFVGSFGFFVTYFRSGSFAGETLFGASQVQSSSGNPPQIAAFIIVLTFLIYFYHYLKAKENYLFINSAILLGTLITFKVYAAVVLLPAVGIVTGIAFLFQKRLDLLVMVICSSGLSALLFIPNTQNSSAFLVWEPWWPIRTLIVAPDKLNWLDLELRRQTYISEDNWKRVLQIELTGLLLFLVGNLGIRIIGTFQFIKIFKSKEKLFYLLLALITLISIITPLLFVQKGVAGNTIQFLSYALLVTGLLAAITITQLTKYLKNKLLLIPIIALIVFLSIPTQIGLLQTFYQRPAFAKVPKSEIDALNYLKNETPKDSVILVPIFDQYKKVSDITPPMWAWFDTAYVSALSQRETYLADYEQVQIIGYDLDTRKKIVEDVFAEVNEASFSAKINLINTQYLYFPKSYQPKVDLSKTTLQRVYQNEIVEIWKVN